MAAVSVAAAAVGRAEGEEDDCDWRASDSWNCEPQIEGRKEDQNIESERVIALTIEVPVPKGEGPNELGWVISTCRRSKNIPQLSTRF